MCQGKLVVVSVTSFAGDFTNVWNFEACMERMFDVSDFVLHRCIIDLMEFQTINYVLISCTVVVVYY